MLDPTKSVESINRVTNPIKTASSEPVLAKRSTRLSTQYANMLPTFAKLSITINRVTEDLVTVTINKLYNDKKWWNNAKAWESLTFGLGGGAIGVAGSFLTADAQKVTDVVSKMFPHFKEVTVTLTEGKIINIDGRLKDTQDFHLQLSLSNDKENAEAVKRMGQSASTEMELLSSLIALASKS